MSPIEKDHSRGWNAAVAAQVRAERAAKGWTLDSLAAKSGVPKRTLIRLVKTERAFDVAQLAAIAEALDITMSEFLSRADARLSEVSGEVALAALDSDESAGASEDD